MIRGLILVTIFACSITGCQSSSNESRTASVKPRDLKAHYQKVLLFWEDKLRVDPHSFIARKKIASTKMELARATGNEQFYREAEQLLLETRTYAPGGATDEEYHLLLGAALMSRHQFAKALSTIEERLATAPKSLPLRLSRGDALCGLGQYEECRTVFAELVEERPCYDTWVRLAQAEESMGRTAEAIELIELAERSTKHLRPENEAWIIVRLASIKLKQSDLDGAERDLTRALTIYPDYYLAQEHLAEVYEKRKMWSAAKPWLEKALANRQDPHFLERMAVVVDNMGDHEAAEKLNIQALNILEDWYAKEPGAHARDLAEALIRRGDSKRAAELVKVDLALRPEDTRSNFIAAQTLRMAGKADEAKAHIDIATRYSNNDPDIALEKATITSILG